MVKRKTGASGSHCGKFWVKWVACSKSWRDWSVRKDFDQGKSFFRPMFGKVIHWIVVIFFFLECSLPHSCIHRLVTVGPCERGCDRDTWLCGPETLTIYIFFTL